MGGFCIVIVGVDFKMYIVGDDDYICFVVFGYILVCSDGVVGEFVLFDLSFFLYFEVLCIYKLVLKGLVVEGEMFIVLEVIFRGDV